MHVQTQHGTPLKKMGLGLLDYPVGAAGMDFPKLLRRSDRWDYLVSSNRYSSEVWERSFPSSYVTLEVGLPANDRLVTATAAETERIRAELGLPADKTVLLYAPTFRDWIRDQFDSPIDLLDFCERLGDDYVVLVRAHYFTERDERTRAVGGAGPAARRDRLPSIEDLMIASDVLITDYSSVMFDYANLDRPIVIYAPDWDTYRGSAGSTSTCSRAAGSGRDDPGRAGRRARLGAVPRHGELPAQGVRADLLRVGRRACGRTRRAPGVPRRPPTHTRNSPRAWRKAMPVRREICSAAYPQAEEHVDDARGCLAVVPGRELLPGTP